MEGSFEDKSLMWMVQDDDSNTLKVQKIIPEAILPERKTEGAAGFDLVYPYHDTLYIDTQTSLVVPTGIKVKIPFDCYGRIAERSSLAVQCNIGVGGGVIDSDYRGEIKVILRNYSKEFRFKITKGDRIAQLVIERIKKPIVIEVKSLDTTKRGVNGFGSTGLK